ncbi:hypothetical protein [Primorskyibacter sp. S87]|uniref:hypothetical protein n=1 Tax=Primorskyibacter sp. S87 TaxID=3415126 RepID=UPI003C7E47CC
MHVVFSLRRKQAIALIAAARGEPETDGLHAIDQNLTDGLGCLYRPSLARPDRLQEIGKFGRQAVKIPVDYALAGAHDPHDGAVIQMSIIEGKADRCPCIRVWNDRFGQNRKPRPFACR